MDNFKERQLKASERNTGKLINSKVETKERMIELWNIRKESSYLM